MRSKSIDGLKRRGESNQLGFPEKRDKKIAKVKAEAMGAPARRKFEAGGGGVRKSGKEEQDTAIRDFLSSVQDDDPTNLVSGDSMEKNEPKKRKKDKKPRGKRRLLKIIVRTLGVVLLIVVAAVAWLYIQGNDLVSRVTGGNLLNVLLADPDIPLSTDPSSGRTNVLIFGTEGYSMDDTKWNGGWLTDTIMVASIDQDSGDVRTISLPRDLKAKTCTSTSKLNEVYYCTYSKSQKTAESRAEYEKLAARALANQVEEILGIKIQYFVHANWQAVVQIVDALNGIDVAFVYKGTTWPGDEVAVETMDKRGLRDYYDSRKQKWGLDYKNGEVVHLDGEQALGVVRSRNSSGGYGSGSNFSREQFQQKILQAIVLKAKETNFAVDFIAALSIKDAVGDNLRMDFKDTELKALFKLVGRIDMGGLKSISIQDADDGTRLMTTGMLESSNGQFYSYVYPAAGVGNYTKIHAYVERKLSSDPLMSENARILVMNATDVTGLAATESAKLKEKGYNVTQNMNAPSALGAVDGVKVYQLNKHLSGTAKALKQLYGKVNSTSIPESLTSYAADFIVVFGNGYAAGD